MTKLMEIAVAKIIAELYRQGEALIVKAARTKETNNITFNQMESYGWAVWHNGKRMRTGYTDEAKIGFSGRRDEYGNIEERFYDGRRIVGLDELNRAYKRLDSELASKKGFVLAILNAVPYTRDLEEGLWVTEDEKKIRRKYRVISQVFTDLRAVGAPFKGAKVRTLA